MSLYLRPTGPVAPDAILPGDPKRAMDLAAAITDKPLMTNLARGLWGYHGATPDGGEVTVQATGIGGPSAALVVTDLARLGARRVVRVGTCTAIDSGLGLGSAVVVSEAIAGDGAGASLCDSGWVRASRSLTASLARSTGVAPATVVSTDLPSPRRGGHAHWASRGAIASDLSAAAVLAAARGEGIDAACALVVSETANGDRLDDDALDGAALELGRAAAAAFAAAARQASPAS